MNRSQVSVEPRRRPIRTCVGCRTRAAQSRLIRLTRRSDGVAVVAPRGRDLAGRSAYLCPKRACFDRAIRRRAIERSLAGPHKRAVHSQVEPLWSAISQELEREVASEGCDSATSHRVRRNASAKLPKRSSEAGKGA